MTTRVPSSLDQVLNTRLRTGLAVSASGEQVEIRRFALSAEAAGLLGRFTAAIDPRMIVEVGCASGVSTMTMAAAAPESRIVAMDPKQDTHWKGIARVALAEAGLEDRVTLRTERSDEGLPKLIAEGVRAQLAFIDGWHMLDYVMMEALLVDRMLDEGGLILIHDLWMPALQHFACFWTANHAYEAVTLREGRVVAEPWSPEPTEQQREIRLHPETLPRFVREIAPFVDRSILALRKIGEDERAWDAFAAYSG